MRATKYERETRDYWSDCGQIFFHYGKGYGITENLQTVCLGDETDILDALNGGEINPKLTPIERQTFSDIIQYNKELKLNEQQEFQAVRGSAIRSRLAGTVKSRKARIRQTSARRKPALH